MGLQEERQEQLQLTTLIDKVFQRASASEQFRQAMCESVFAYRHVCVCGLAKWDVFLTADFVTIQPFKCMNVFIPAVKIKHIIIYELADNKAHCFNQVVVKPPIRARPYHHIVCAVSDMGEYLIFHGTHASLSNLLLPDN